MEKEEEEKFIDRVSKEMNIIAEKEYIKYHDTNIFCIFKTSKSSWKEGFIRGCIFIQQINKLNNLKLNKNE